MYGKELNFFSKKKKNFFISLLAHHHTAEQAPNNPTPDQIDLLFFSSMKEKPTKLHGLLVWYGGGEQEEKRWRSILCITADEEN